MEGHWTQIYKVKWWVSRFNFSAPLFFFFFNNILKILNIRKEMVTRVFLASLEMQGWALEYKR